MRNKLFLEQRTRMQRSHPAKKNDFKHASALIIVTILVGIGSGLLGTLLAFLLHGIQHLAYGYSPNAIISNESFLEGLRASSAERRVMILILCGLIAGIGWWALYRYGKPLVSIVEAVKTGKVMPWGATTIHVLLQIVTIALGSPLGREVAPREMGAIFAYRISSKMGLNKREAQVMLACGAGAGLAAVYNVPLGGALFVLEVLLGTFHWSVLLPALATSVIAVVVSWIGLGNAPLYHIPHLTINASLVTWSIITGPIFGLAAYGFIEIANAARKRALHDWRMVLACLINFTLIGFLAIYAPALLGNGKSPVQLEFSDAISIGFSFILLLLRMCICWSSLNVGAQGGLLTPSLANGALLAVVLGGVWASFWPGVSMNAFALVGATAFLATAQKMPITAIVLIFEFTRVDMIFLIPLMFSIAGAMGMVWVCQNKLRSK